MINRFAGTFYLEQFSYIISLVYGLRPFYSAVVNLDRLDLPVQKAFDVGTVRYWYTPGICHLRGIVSVRPVSNICKSVLVCWENCVLRTARLSPIKIRTPYMEPKNLLRQLLSW